MARLGRWIWITLALLLVATAAAAAIPRFGLELLPAHTARGSTATLDDALSKAIDTSIAKAAPATIEEARDLALAVSDKLLHFGLDHATNLAFAAVDREGNCIEYSQLFAKVFDRAAAQGGMRAKAYVVHSNARLFGEKLPFRGWADHDWVLVEDRGAGKRLFVDPTMHDAGMGWDVATNVRGDVRVP